MSDEETELSEYNTKLIKEYNELRTLNETLQSTIASISQSRTNINNLNNSTSNSIELIDIWNKIISQNSHISSLLNDRENWNGNETLNNQLVDRQKELVNLQKEWDDLNK